MQRPVTTGSTGRTDAYASAPRGWVNAPEVGFTYSRKSSRKHYRKSASRVLPRFLGTYLLTGFFSATALFGLWQSGQINEFINENGPLYHVAARAFGLGIDRVTIAGINQLRESEILGAAGISPKVSLLFVDANEMRDQLERMPLVKTAAVRKLYPNELVITLTEREPFAIWQLNGELFIVAEDGTVIDHTVDARFASLPLVVGENANKHIKEYLALLDAAGPLKKRIRAGTYVAGRRWTLKMENGVDVRLPETGTMEALQRMVSLERAQSVLEKDILAVDLRMPDRVVVRLSGEAAAARAETMKKKKFYGVKGIQS
ncbi:cell division protein FtsQ/DivIB [Microvirga sp. W0021]|uniref:Cell division protein FtsQ n=1 Tax=Hohaiivirga grylli TaxID=3133970 RepID=A0ABV0BK46_9HYPH